VAPGVVGRVSDRRRPLPPTAYGRMMAGRMIGRMMGRMICMVVFTSFPGRR
jgi:hypothetical protein